MSGNIPEKIKGWQFTAPEKALEPAEYDVPGLKEEDILVRVAGCGLCHTDMSFIYGGVRTKAELPLTLGHEISGTVVSAGPALSRLVGKNVVIPAVLPCGECDLCRKGRGNVCRKQVMPGNDFHGGFADYIAVPGKFAAVVDDLKGFDLAELSVIADAVTTPYMAVKKARVEKGDLAIVVGVGGIGTYAVQVAAAFGATVIAVDIDDKKLEKLRGYGAAYTVNVTGKDTKEAQKEIRDLAKNKSLPRYGWKVFETSGTAPGQDLGFALLSFAGTLGVVGFTMDKVKIRLSNMMAFDADAFGVWGCLPEYYPDAINLALDGKIEIRDFSERHPMSEINDVIQLAKEHKLEKRAILEPGA
ncbi:MAG: 6-hydroxycyclohex-1-ene-1-carbonyl-CoA dehydrogenase [Pseudomonadota bacterium]